LVVACTPRGPAAIAGACFAAAAAGATAGAAGCSLLQSYDGYVGTDATAPGEAGGDTRAEAAEAAGQTLSACTMSQGANGLCAPAVPHGWAGPLILFEGPTDPAQVCASGYTSSCNGCLLHASPSTAEATCAACSCDPSPVSCGVWLAPGCPQQGQAFDGGFPFVAPGCYALPNGIDPQMVVGSYAAPVGSCAARGGQATVPPAWQESATACIPTAQLQQGSCASGEWCLATPPPPFPPAFCVSQPGTVDCPSGSPYVVTRTVYDDAGDTRGCSSCTCGAPDGGMNAMNGGCIGDIQSCMDDACAGCSPVVCKLGIQGPVLVQIDPTFQGGCDHGGGQPTGQLTPTGATTFCCTQ
jgi:hypothetical protein